MFILHNKNSRQLTGADIRRHVWGGIGSHYHFHADDGVKVEGGSVLQDKCIAVVQQNDLGACPLDVESIFLVSATVTVYCENLITHIRQGGGTVITR